MVQILTTAEEIQESGEWEEEGKKKIENSGRWKSADI